MILVGPARMALAQDLRPKVLIVTHDLQSWLDQYIVPALAATGQFSQIDGWSMNRINPSNPNLVQRWRSTPTLSYLLANGYQAVLYYYDDPQALPDSFGTVLAHYVDTGGGVVLAQSCFTKPTIAVGINSDFNNPTYQVMIAGVTNTLSNPASELGPVLLPNHPLMNNVHTFNGGVNDNWSKANIGLSPKAYVVAEWGPETINAPLIVARENVGAKGVRRVDLNFYPVSNALVAALYGDYIDYWTGDGNIIMANALSWVAGYAYDFTLDSITNPRPGSFQSIGTPLIPTVNIMNHGHSVPTSVTIRNQITPLGGGAPVYSQDVVLTGSNVPASFRLDAIQFPPFIPTTYNAYEDTVRILYMEPVTDQFPADNIATSEFLVTQPNDIKALQFDDPLPNSYASAGIPTPIIITFRNIGGSAQTNVPLLAVIEDQTGAVVYRDTEYALSWPSGQTRDVTFKNWSLTNVGPYTFYGIALLPTDQVRANDTISETVRIRYDYDAATVGIINPQPGEQKPYTLAWQPTVYFQSHGSQDLFNVPVRVQIRRCSDGGLVFQADSTAEALNYDIFEQKFSFPSKQGVYDISKIPSGCYTMCAMTLLPNDADRTNDTACTQFTVVDRLQGDIYVGVGQRFQTITLALDSLKFRGIGGNVRLILTDNNYAESGTYFDTVTRTNLPTTDIADLNFSGIRGLSDTSTVTWIPNTGVTPHITFTGNKQFCFYFGDRVGGYMTFEGYNPAGAPVPDKLTAEPNKRNTTIVNNLSRAGAAFGIEEGASNITLKDLVLTNNGKFSNDSDAVVRIYNEQSRAFYTGNGGTTTPVTDTMPIHNIRIENCELGNAKYGIWDHALHTQFNIGKSVFVDWRNYNNVFTRNTIGTSTSPLSYTGIQFNNELNLTISHNEVSNINGALGGFPNVYGIDQPSVLQSDTGNTVGVWIDANRVHNLAATSKTYGIAFQQAATIYTVGTGPNAVHSALPTVTSNRMTNNMIFDLRGAIANYPLTYTTAAATYSTDRDSIFDNSISTKNATINIFVAQTKHAFLWNNIIQNTGAGPYTNYSLQLPRPFQSAVSSDYNLFDLRGSNVFATVTEYDLNSGTALQWRTFRRLNDWRTYTQQDLHSLTGDPLFASDSLHEPSALSYLESPASNSGAWLNTATQLHDFDGDLRLQGNQTPDIGADEFDGFQYSSDLAVLSITQPAGYSATSDTTSVTIENPLWITAQVKNLSSQAVFNVPISATVEVAISGGPWTTIYTGSTSPMNFEVNETKSVTFQGPVITQAQAQTGVFRVTVTTPNDQNNANNTVQKVFRVLLKNNATLVSYTSTSPFALRNRDSVTAALRRLGIAYDSLDRKTYGLQDIDYAPWWTLIWSADSTTVERDSTPPPIYSRVNNYQQTNSTAIWTDIATTGTYFAFPGTGIDTTYGSISLPFNFFYDSAFIPAGTILHAGADGAIGLVPGVTLPHSNFTPPPGTSTVGSSTYPGLLCFFVGGGNTAGANGFYQVDGTAPNRVLTIEYSGWYRYQANSPLPRCHIQVKLYEANGTIEFIYLEHNFNLGSSSTFYNSIGLNGLSTTTTPSAPSFTFLAYPGYTTPQATTPATDIRWQGGIIQPPPLPPVYGPGALSFKETQDVERYLQAGQTYAKKSLIMAGQNIAFSNALVQVNNSVTDTEFMKSYLHTVYRANTPTGGPYNGTIQGQQTDYWKFADHLNSTSPDVVAPSFLTSTVGSEITGLAYAYLTHPVTPSDSGAGTTYTNPKINTVFYGFDWSDPVQTTPSEAGSLTSGTTRILKGALDFITSHSGTVLPVEFTDVTARRVNGNGLISWTTAHQSDVARFEIERADGAGPGAAVGTLHAVGDVNADMYAFTDAGIDPTKTYTYRIAAVDLSGAKTYSPEAELGPDGSIGFTLDQNYPNPASGLTSIRFALPVNAMITLRILDVTGKIVSTEIDNEAMQAGEQAYELDASKYASGSYIYELTAVAPNGQTVMLTKKMTFDK